ncbi:hypothetical protein D3C72_1803880 [compost metagenome]
MAHHARKRRLDDVEARLRGGRTCLRQQGLHLRLAGAPLGLCPVQRGLADVLLLEQLLLALVFLGRDVLGGARGVHLGRAGSGVLLRCVCVNARQLLACRNAVARLGGKTDHRALHLGREGGVPHGLDLGVHTARQLGGSGLDGKGGDRLRSGIASRPGAGHGQGKRCGQQGQGLHGGSRESL